MPSFEAVDDGQKSSTSNIPFPPISASSPLRRTPRLPWLELKLFAWLPPASFAFMTYSCVTAIYQSKGDPGTVGFVAGSLSILAGLYYCMNEYEKAVLQRAATKRERLKLAIWLLALSLNTLFAYRITSVMDSAVFSIIIWGIAAATTMLGCYLIFFSAQAPEGAAGPL